MDDLEAMNWTMGTSFALTSRALPPQAVRTRDWLPRLATVDNIMSNKLPLSRSDCMHQRHTLTQSLPLQTCRTWAHQRRAIRLRRSRSVPSKQKRSRWCAQPPASVRCFVHAPCSMLHAPPWTHENKTHCDSLGSRPAAEQDPGGVCSFAYASTATWLCTACHREQQILVNNI